MQSNMNQDSHYSKYKASLLTLLLIASISFAQPAFARPPHSVSISEPAQTILSRSTPSDAKLFLKYLLTQIMPTLSNMLLPSSEPDFVPAGTNTGIGQSTLAAGFITAENFTRTLLQTTIVGAVDTNRPPLECLTSYVLRIWDNPQAAANNLAQGNVANINVPITSQNIYSMGPGPYGLNTYAITLTLPNIKLLAHSEYVVAFTVLSNFFCGTFYALTTNYASAANLLNILVGPDFGVFYLDQSIAMSFSGYSTAAPKLQYSDAAHVSIGKK